MRTEIYICDTCNADMTETVGRFGEWQGAYRASGGLAGANSDGVRLDVDACSLTCLLEGIQKVVAANV